MSLHLRTIASLSLTILICVPHLPAQTAEDQRDIDIENGIFEANTPPAASSEAAPAETTPAEAAGEAAETEAVPAETAGEAAGEQTAGEEPTGTESAPNQAAEGAAPVESAPEAAETGTAPAENEPETAGGEASDQAAGAPETLPTETAELPAAGKTLPLRAAASPEVPELLRGIWENRSRLIQFAPPEESQSNVSIILKPFYGWYYDRAAESTADERDTNNTASPEAEHLRILFSQSIDPAADSGAWDLEVLYGGNRAKSLVSTARIGEGIYLDFLVHGSAYESDTAVSPSRTENTLSEGFWRAAGNADSISVSGSRSAQEVFSYYITPEASYKIRYWKTDAPYEAVQAVFDQDGTSFSLDKYILIGDTVYTCVTGRGLNIRQVETLSAPPEVQALSDDGRIASLSVPYLTRAENQSDLSAQIKAANSRRRPPPDPIFPPSDLDFHYDLIENLRQYTPGLPRTDE